MSLEPGPPPSAVDAAERGSSVVRRVDHLPVFLSDPRPLFRALTERLGLPVLVQVARWTGLRAAWSC
jgi:hypothetical protein